jgi:hypothetical protein
MEVLITDSTKPGVVQAANGEKPMAVDTSQANQ